ncbi:hypothetical protein BOTBODRAFT_328574 [Botryobasidium botryosum FD-172 SS1]|uniref:Uncharacterized protein n=1 Tax=Botryobasidium botryosum (strain FD-172 SS1) TaxID=930990 RepID=A0A067MZP8_BOTB1|nr:hypothetical protein BOTBODRAFT_328574 [Botryobasidium botryosum FD-172 SS1]
MKSDVLSTYSKCVPSYIGEARDFGAPGHDCATGAAAPFTGLLLYRVSQVQLQELSTDTCFFFFFSSSLSLFFVYFYILRIILAINLCRHVFLFFLVLAC